MKNHYQLLIIGGGTAGIMTAAQALKRNSKLSVGLIEPSEKHYYQPAWTLVGAGTYDYNKTVREEKKFIPKGTDWIKDYAVGFKPKQNTVTTKSSGDISYDILVIAPGLIMDTSLIEGLTESLDKGVVCSNYTNPEHTWNVLKNFKGGNAVFTQPTTPIKCGGAPQKAAYLSADYIRKNGLSNKSNVVFATPGSVIFGVKPIAKTLLEVIKRYDIHFKPFYAPIKIDGDNRIITFKNIAPDSNSFASNEGSPLNEKVKENATIEMPFEMLHLAPPQTAPKFIKESELANEAGWLDVDHGTLQHNTFTNIFGLGDVAGLPTAKTGAAIRKQVPIVVENISRLLDSQVIGDNKYNGYSSCPLVTGYGKMVLAEFDYNSNFIPDPKLKLMLISNSDKESWRLWILKKYILPYLYWNKMLKGKEV
ncbi:NAD(P)/FAD-dependent oxidoreductase [Aestuariibaculum sediminum]|uniref:NAD(P)/FAD-dependent oxidoreductase n=1 Tax=Aestuariibaculum sediminum TaxID=2770637 RepID=A0A8J6UET8_9FLAO|nr:FAD/NAD(P)-binding oxidoreductase [Aestuariibaculum sediminum]MBD0831001.1 NAD(P)/FAD-dependent oxidoreductase [Aestuariibaculum sediminum]